MTGLPPGLLARTEQMYTGCQRMLDRYLRIADEAATVRGEVPAQVWATIAREIVGDRDYDEAGEEVVALAGVFAAAVVAVSEARAGAAT